LLLLTFLVSSHLDQGTTKSGKYFRIVCDFRDPAVAAAALEAADTAWPIAAKLFGAPDARPEKLLDIHLFRTQAAYEKANEEVSGGRFKSNLAFTSWERGAAYVLLQPQCSDDALRTLGLPLLTRRLIAHEAAHLVRYATIPNHASHPGWFADGSASWVAEETLAALRRSPGVEEDPFISTELGRVQDLLSTGKLPSARAIFLDETAELSFYERYALRGAFFRFLATGERREAFHRILAELRRLGGGSDYEERLLSFVEEILGHDGFAPLDRGFADHLRSIAPQWEEVLRSLEPEGDDWIQLAFPDTNAIAWRTDPVGKDAYSITGEVEIAPGPSQQLNLLLGRGDEGFVSIAFVAGYGVTVFRYDSAADRWNRLGDATVTSRQAGKRTRFRAAVRGGELGVEVGGRKVLEVPLGAREMGGPWGLGAQAGSAGRWRAIRLPE
jgi:hypothetical protein